MLSSAPSTARCSRRRGRRACRGRARLRGDDGRGRDGQQQAAEARRRCASMRPGATARGVPARAAQTTPAAAKNHANSAGISQSQSIPAWTSSASPAARKAACAWRSAPRSRRARRRAATSSATASSSSPGQPELGQHLEVERVRVGDVERDVALALPLQPVGAGAGPGQRLCAERVARDVPVLDPSVGAGLESRSRWSPVAAMSLRSKNSCALVVDPLRQRRWRPRPTASAAAAADAPTSMRGAARRVTRTRVDPRGRAAGRAPAGPSPQRAARARRARRVGLVGERDRPWRGSRRRSRHHRRGDRGSAAPPARRAAGAGAPAHVDDHADRAATMPPRENVKYSVVGEDGQRAGAEHAHHGALARRPRCSAARAPCRARRARRARSSTSAGTRAATARARAGRERVRATAASTARPPRSAPTASATRSSPVEVAARGGERAHKAQHQRVRQRAVELDSARNGASDHSADSSVQAASSPSAPGQHRERRAPAGERRPPSVTRPTSRSANTTTSTAGVPAKNPPARNASASVSSAGSSRCQRGAAGAARLRAPRRGPRPPHPRAWPARPGAATCAPSTTVLGLPRCGRRVGHRPVMPGAGGRRRPRWVGRR